MYEHDGIVPDKTSRSTKKDQVSAMFDKIAGKYDFFNRFLSMGIDVGWRKKALKELTNIQSGYLLDIATGTADFALLASKILKPRKIVGIDISNEMLKIGAKKVEKANCEHVIELQTGDAEAINFAENTFDAVIVAFGVRNFQNLEKGLQEIYRVLKKGQRLVVLEFSKPKNNKWHKLYNLYNGVVAPKIVSVFSKNRKAYEYLNDSINAFPERNNFIEVLQKTGFGNCYFKELSFGICCIYVAEK